MVLLNFAFSGCLVHQRVFLGQGHAKGLWKFTEGGKVMVKSTESTESTGKDGGQRFGHRGHLDGQLQTRRLLTFSVTASCGDSDLPSNDITDVLHMYMI